MILYFHRLRYAFYVLTWWLILVSRNPCHSLISGIWRRGSYTFSDSCDETTIDAHFQKLALEQATEAGRVGEVPIGAILVQRERHHNATRYRILARAGNRVEHLHDASAHAELQVLRKGAKRIKNWRLLNTTLYSTLEPCPMCLAACQAFRVPRLVYGAPDLRLGAVETHMRLLDLAHPYHNVSHVHKGVCAEESADILRAFFRRKRKQKGGRGEKPWFTWRRPKQ